MSKLNYEDSDFDAEEFDKKFRQLMDDYEKKFGEMIAMYQVSSEDFVHILEILQHCIDTNTPYKYQQLPKGCIA